MVVGEQFSFCSVERLGGSLELAPSVTSRTDLVLALPCNWMRSVLEQLVYC